jgi:hypothetical protein
MSEHVLWQPGPEHLAVVQEGPYGFLPVLCIIYGPDQIRPPLQYTRLELLLAGFRPKIRALPLRWAGEPVHTSLDWLKRCTGYGGRAEADGRRGPLLATLGGTLYTFQASTWTITPA